MSKVAALRAKQAQTRGNMRTVQIALEYFALYSGGVYPKSILECRKYLTGNEKNFDPKTPFPTNAFSGATNETPYAAGVTSLTQIDKMRSMPPQFTKGKAGQIGYSVLDNGQYYALIGTDSNGNAIADKNEKTMILSNH